MTDWIDGFLDHHNNPDVHADLQAFLEWRHASGVEHPLHGRNDDVDIRTYLITLRNAGEKRSVIKRNLDSLRLFYGWLRENNRIETSPFERYDFDRPILTLDDINRRHDSAGTDDPADRARAHLDVINTIARELNRVSDLQSALNLTLDTLVETMGLRTAWVFLRADHPLHQYANGYSPLHRHTLVASTGLPSGLSGDDCLHLRSAPACHCQWFMDEGQLRRAINVVECSRIDRSHDADSDTENLAFHASVPLTCRDEVVGILNVATEDWLFFSSHDLNLLTTISSILSAALDRILHFEIARAHRFRLTEELKLAYQVQASLIPDTCPGIPGFELASLWQPAREVAGDFFDVFPIDEVHYGLVIADVSDKGAPAALYMTMVSSLLKAIAGHIDSPSATLEELNRQLLLRSSSGMFVSVWFGIANTQDGTIRYAVAGHDPPVVVTSHGETSMLPRGGILLGLFEDITLPEYSLSLAPGENLILYTDGVTDLENPLREQYGMDRFRQSLSRCCTLDVDDLFGTVLDDIHAFKEDAPQFDDITLLAVRRR